MDSMENFKFLEKINNEYKKDTVQKKEYIHPMFEDDIQLVDMVYLKKERNI